MKYAAGIARKFLEEFCTRFIPEIPLCLREKGRRVWRRGDCANLIRYSTEERATWNSSLTHGDYEWHMKNSILPLRLKMNATFPKLRFDSIPYTSLSITVLPGLYPVFP